jgi:nucleoside-diphosphate-sugar epimerase
LTHSGYDVLPFSFSGMLDGREPSIGERADVCIHLAARVHLMNDRSSDPLTEFRRSNVEGTLRLARHAAFTGVRRFIFVSSIKVNGEATEPDHPFSADHPPAPRDPYGVSKLEAETALMDLSRQTGMEVVIIRPPLVYGPGVKANFETMMRWIYWGVPLPIGALRNRRSLVGLDNLVSMLETCMVHAAAANRTFLVSDDADLSTPELAVRLGEALGKPARLVPVPASLLSFGASLVGKPEVVQRLGGSLQVDISTTRAVLGWAPPVTVDEGLRRTAESWINSLR